MRTLISSYSFNKTAKQITFSGFVSISLEKVLMITDVTNQTVIYQANAAGLGGSVSNNVLTLQYDTTGAGFSNSDSLQIFYEMSDTEVVIPVSATSLPLPSGAATAAKQPALGTAGSASSDVLTVQGSAGMTPIAISGDITASNASVSATGSTVPASATYTGFLDSTGKLAGAKLNSSQALTVDGSAVTQPVSGTVAATQSGAWNVTNVSGTVSLPTGAATSALQSAVQSAPGSAQTTAITVQGNASGIPIPISGNITASNPSVETIGSDAPSSATYTGFLNSSGKLVGAKVNGSQALTVDGSAVTQPVSGTVSASQSGTWNINDVSGTISLPTGASTAANQTAVQSSPGSSASTAITVQGSASGVAIPVSGTVTAQQSTAANLNATVVQSTATNLKTQAEIYQGGTAVGAAAPLQVSIANTGANSTAVKVDGSAVTQPVSGTVAATQSGTWKAPINTTGSGSAAGATVSTVTTLTAPSNAVGFVLMNMDTSTANIRYAIGRTATTSLGQQLQPGRDTGFIPCGANISLIAESGTQTYDVQWICQ